MRPVSYILALLLCGCASLTRAQEYPVLERDAKGHITHRQAEEIADVFFRQNIGCCGGINNRAVLTKTAWLFSYKEGYAAVPSKNPISVSLTTGTVSCPGYPSIQDPVTLLQKNAKP